MFHEQELRQELAQSVSSYLMFRKNILEVVLSSQLATDKTKYLELYGDNITTRIYSAHGEIRTIVNSNNQTDFEALKNLSLSFFSFDDVLDSRPVHKSAELSLADISLSLQNSDGSSSCSQTHSACYINSDLHVSYINQGVSLPEKELVNYVIELLKVFDKSTSPERIDFTYRGKFTITLTKENNRFLLLCNTLTSG